MIMALKPESSLMVGLATATVVFGIHSQATPSVTDVRLAPTGDNDIASATSTATWLSAAAVAGISLIAKDPTVFIIGGVMTVAMAWFYKHGNEVNPEYGRAVPKGDQLAEQFDESSMADAEDYANAAPAGLF